MKAHTVTLRLKILIVCAFFIVGYSAEAATLRVSPNTGIYTVGKAFTINVVLNTEGKAVNAADGQLSFNPRELQVTNASKGSIFSLWTQEPTYSNSAGTISFGGGSPAGYTGSAGTIMSVSFRPLAAGTPKLAFKSGSVLAADGMGTNVLSSMSGGTYTIAAVTDDPAPEYIPPANTPKAPVVTSSTHEDQTRWYKAITAELAWILPEDVIAVRTLLDDKEGTVPTIVYEERITQKTIEDLPQGISYFHIQFKNKEGWGRITHYTLAVDSEAPQGFAITDVTEGDNPQRTFAFSVEDISPILEYKIQIDGKEPVVYKDEAQTRRYTLETLAPGYHSIIVEASDSAGNSTIATHSLTIEAFEKPVFTEYPTRINTEVIPALKGTTRPNAKVTVEVSDVDGNEINNGGVSIETMSNDRGEFVVIPGESFSQGVYSFRAIATDSFGRMSEPSDEIRIIVEAPGYMVIGSFVISVLSILIPALALILLLMFGTWYLWHKLSRWRKKVRRETLDAEEKLTLEFNQLVQHIDAKIDALKESRKGKPTRAETDLIEEIELSLASAKKHIGKEIKDIEEVI